MRIIGLVFGLLALLVCGDVNALQYNADVNRGACASNYVRSAPGICLRAPGTAGISIGLFSVGCNTKSISASVPANAKTALLSATGIVNGQGATTLRGFVITVYGDTDTTCASTSTYSMAFEVREFVAFSGEILEVSYNMGNYPIPSSPTVNVRIVELNAGDYSSASISLIGYTD